MKTNLTIAAFFLLCSFQVLAQADLKTTMAELGKSNKIVALSIMKENLISDETIAHANKVLAGLEIAQNQKPSIPGADLEAYKKSMAATILLYKQLIVEMEAEKNKADVSKSKAQLQKVLAAQKAAHAQFKE